MQSRLYKTAADYLAIALSPILIMALVGSLTFFLLEISYAGEYTMRLRWMLFWFVLASVLVSRISIEQGAGYASVYGIALALASGMLIYRFVGLVVPVWICLALIWWSTSKLTWDCTLIDDDEDASGEGLLQVAGIDKPVSPPPPQSNSQIAPQENAPAAPLIQTDSTSRKSKKAGRPPHAPGLWVVYFSIAALPVFGVGQLLLPDGNPFKRQYGLILLTVYLAAGLGLLLTTSFLGLRRYLRQRRLQMPARIARSWIAVGAALIAAVLVASVLLPQPDAVYSLTSLFQKITSPKQDLSELDLFSDGNQGGDTGDPADGSQSASNPARGNDPAAGGAGGNATGPSSASNPPSAQSPNIPPFDWLKWLIYLLLAILIIRRLYRYLPRLWAALKSMLQNWLAFLHKLFSWPARAPASAAATNSIRPNAPPRPFRAFQNPFSTGMANRWTPDELVQYTFEALQAWARESGSGRTPEQTPSEFGAQIATLIPSAAAELRHLSHSYTRLAYAGGLPPTPLADDLQRLWNHLSQPPPPA